MKTNRTRNEKLYDQQLPKTNKLMIISDQFDMVSVIRKCSDYILLETRVETRIRVAFAKLQQVVV